MVHAVRKFAKRVSRQRIGNVHDHQNDGQPGNVQATVFRPQQQEGLAEPRQGKHGTNCHHRPVGTAQLLQARTAYGIGTPFGDGLFRFANTNHQQQHCQRGGYHCHPEHRLIVVLPKQHQADRQQGAEKRPHGVQGLTQAIGRPSYFRGCEIRHQGVARRTSDAFSDTIGKPRRQNPPQPRCEGKHRFGQCAQTIPQNRQPLALTQIVTQGARKHLGDRRGRFRRALNQPDH